jgi:hypothetical protein
MQLMLVGVALLALTVTKANAADSSSAGSMLPHCKASLDYPPGTFIQGFCAGMVVGVAALAQPLFAPGQSRATERCVSIPENVSNRQLIQAVVRYIEARPQRINEQFRVLATEALFDAWPCQK